MRGTLLTVLGDSKIHYDKNTEDADTVGNGSTISMSKRTTKVAVHIKKISLEPLKRIVLLFVALRMRSQMRGRMAEKHVVALFTAEIQPRHESQH